MTGWLAIAAAQRAFYAANFLPHRCTVTRPGATAAADVTQRAVPCRWVPANVREWGLEPGAFVSQRAYTVRFGPCADVRQGDYLQQTDTAEGRFEVHDVQPLGAYAPAMRVLAVRAA